jgi:putative addiction module component (TIGR02574 family)
MSETGESILIAALELSVDDRVKIACDLLETVPENDADLEAEIERWEATLPDEKPVISMRLGDTEEEENYVPTPLSDAGRALLSAALATSALDRAIISRELFGSAPPPGWVEVTDEEMYAELQRRIEESERNPDDCISWEILRDER